MSPSSTSVAEPTTTTAPAGVNGTPTPPDPQAQPPVDPEATLVPQPVAQLASVEPPKPPEPKSAEAKAKEPLGLKAWFTAQIDWILGLINTQKEKLDDHGNRLVSVEGSNSQLSNRVAGIEASTGTFAQQLQQVGANVATLHGSFLAASEDSIITPQEQEDMERRFKELEAAIKKIK